MAFHGNIALITGAASGMGRLAARRLAAGGATIAALDVNEAGLEETARAWPNIHTYLCDVTDEARVNAVFQQVADDLGPIDRVMHAAAIMPTALALEMDTGLIRKLMEINYFGTVNVVRAGLPSLLARDRGDLILFGSVAGWVPSTHLSAYNASKAAVNAFVEVLMEENKGSHVRIMLVCPPMVDTPLLDQATESSNPSLIQLGRSQGRPVSPSFILDSIETGIDKGKQVLLPGGEAKMLYALRRLSPRLLWKIQSSAEQAWDDGKIPGA